MYAIRLVDNKQRICYSFQTRMASDDETGKQYVFACALMLVNGATSAELEDVLLRTTISTGIRLNACAALTNANTRLANVDIRQMLLRVSKQLTERIANEVETERKRGVGRESSTTALSSVLVSDTGSNKVWRKMVVVFI